ncbi:NAD-dependent epimerase/dehydratase family protein [Nocardioides sp. zg-1308]|uniref:NAD-dependent epimerase/dehydratase family protein n=1 Tax=Nocardioides sp. zg-1308 TaxID=2736253 RepID=UPI0015520651|nr:NAD-dependent epimerase/dehydratase family protein [Nocardioides sp. zg-1308]NPD04275.1 NAD-dependent epimerase/dehydratase family protein [Nocardioides sp. zg-1308]
MTGVAVLGGSSPLVPYLLEHLPQDGSVTLVSRRLAAAPPTAATTTYADAPADLDVARAVSLMPVWELPAYFDWLAERGCRRLVVLSSTSRFTKTASARAHDRDLAARLAGGEDAVEAWAADAGVALTILRPTMVYGGPADGNVSELTRVLRRFRVVPLVGSGSGLRQPVHMGDVAATAARALLADRTPRTAYDISGGEVLAYRRLVDRIRGTVPGPTLVVRVPGWPFRLLERTLPRSRKASLAAGMVDRMGTDMVFDHSAAAADLGHQPRAFTPGV